jgi:hemolysin III
VLDHGAIFLLIAGTYTPFTLGVLRGGWGWTLFGLVWSLAVLGIVLKTVGGVRIPWLSNCLYLGMGWLVLIAIAERLRYSHFIWHLFVLTGTCCHFFAVLWYAA